MKKLLLLLLMFTLSLSFVACSNNNEETLNNEDNEEVIEAYKYVTVSGDEAIYHSLSSITSNSFYEIEDNNIIYKPSLELEYDNKGKVSNINLVLFVNNNEDIFTLETIEALKDYTDNSGKVEYLEEKTINDNVKAISLTFKQEEYNAEYDQALRTYLIDSIQRIDDLKDDLYYDRMENFKTYDGKYLRCIDKEGFFADEISRMVIRYSNNKIPYGYEKIDFDSTDAYDPNVEQ